MHIYDALNELLEQIQARGIPATMDPRNLDVPGAIVTLDSIGPDTTMCGDHDAKALVMLVAADKGQPDATIDLLSMFDKVRDLTTGARLVTFTWSDIPNLPAFQLEPIPLEVD